LYTYDNGDEMKMMRT